MSANKSYITALCGDNNFSNSTENVEETSESLENDLNDPMEENNDTSVVISEEDSIKSDKNEKPSSRRKFKPRKKKNTDENHSNKEQRSGGFKKKSSKKREFKKKGSYKKGSNNKRDKPKDQTFWNELEIASNIFLKECIVDKDELENIEVRARYDLSFTGHNIWFNVGNNDQADIINIKKETDNEFRRTVFFKNNKFRNKVLDKYYELAPDLDVKFIGPTFKTGDLLIKLVPFRD